MKSQAVAGLVCVCLSAGTDRAFAQYVYWADNSYSTIYRAPTDGSRAEEAIIAPSVWSPRGLALHTEADRMYWTDRERVELASADLSGGGKVVLRSAEDGLMNPGGIAVDPLGGKLYWSEVNYQTRTGYIRRSDLNGGAVETVATLTHAFATREPNALALDLIHGMLYWTESGAWQVRRANLDGSNSEVVVTGGVGVPYGIVVDAVGGKFYWVNGSSQQRIERNNLDGSGREIVVADINGPIGIALDAARGRVIWSDSDQRIRSANLSGADRRLLYTSTDRVWTLAVEPAADRLYWAGEGTAPIQSSKLDGTDIRELVLHYAAATSGLVVLPEDGNLWWTRALWGDFRLYRSRLDGSQITLLFQSDEGVVSARGLAVDRVQRRLYWFATMEIDYELQSIALDGTGFHAYVASGLDGVDDFVIEPSTSTVFTVNHVPCALMRLPQSGGQAVTHYADPKTCPAGVAVDSAAARVFWSEPGMDHRIRTSDLAGLNVETLPLPELASPTLLTFEPLTQELYWFNMGIPAIRRAKLDGSNALDVARLPSSVSPGGLGVDLRRPGDLDQSGTVDLRDYASFQNCFTGSGPNEVSAPCVFFDAEPTDGDVDRTDFAAFYAAL
ncbi:MAG: hypothetical protein AABZ47_10115 [Planctomycetota bacterium]